MSIGAFGGLQGSAAGAPLSQTQGSETEKTRQQAAATQRSAEADSKAEDAAGIGRTEEDQETSDRDADGRRFYEDTLEIESEETSEPETIDEVPKSKDATGQTGNTLDLLG